MREEEAASCPQPKPWTCRRIALISSKPPSDRSAYRKRPIFGQQQKIFQPLEKKVGQLVIANRSVCSLQSISSISSKRTQLEKELESGGSGDNDKYDRLRTSKRYVAAAKRRTLHVLVHVLL